MKKNLKTFLIATTLLPLALINGACSCKKGETQKISTQDIREMYALSAISSINYLENQATQQLLNNAITTRPEEITQEAVNEIKTGLTIFDSIIKGEKLETEIEKNNSSQEEYKDYNFKMTINLVNITDTYIMYFNEIETKTNKKIEDEDEEIEVSSKLEGVMVINDARYELIGKKTIEQDNDEKETEIEFITKKDESNYIVVSHSLEQEQNETEIEYEYKIYKNNTKVFELEVEFENEDGKLELEFEMKNITNTGVQKTKYKIKKSSSNNEDFIVTYKINNSEHKIKIKTNDSGYEYNYSNGYSENVKKES